jgi:putative ABC transport system permease protein
MWMFKLAWKNLWRNRNRTIISISAIFFAVVLSTGAEGLKQGVFDNLVKNVVRHHTGHLQIHQKGYQDEQMLDRAMESSDLVESEIRQLQHIEVISPRLETFVLAAAAASTKGCMLMGIDPKSEDSITQLNKKIVRGSFLHLDDSSVMLAEGLARQLKMDVGDTIYLIGQGFHGAMAAGKFQVKGILHFGSPQINDRFLYMGLPVAQDFLSTPNMITTYVVSVKDANVLSKIKNSIQSNISPKLEVLTWEEILPDVKQHIDTDSRNMKWVQGILYILVSFGMLSTMLMLMLERKYEMGLLVALGMNKSILAALFLMESLFTVLVGCFTGLTFSIPLLALLKHHPLKMGGETAKAYERFGFEAIFPASTNLSIFLYQALLVMGIGFLLSCYPIWKVIRLNVAEAIKK